MDRYIFSIVTVVVAGMLIPAAAFCQRFDPEEEPERDMHMRQMQMELEERESQMDFERKMRELELEEHRIKLKQAREKNKHEPHPLLLLVAAVHILTAIWVYIDIRQRNCGSGLWIVLALLAGLLGTLVYAVVRLGDTEKKKG
jgi:hypothetical protein